MRLPSSVQGLIFAPTLICLFFLLKAFCPDSAGSSCFADQFAVPIFLPLVAIHKIFGDTSVVAGQEFLLIMVYWAFIGFLIGLVIDLWRRKEEEVVPYSSPVSAQSIPTHIVRPTPPVPLPLMKKPPLNMLDREEYKS